MTSKTMIAGLLTMMALALPALGQMHQLGGEGAGYMRNWDQIAQQYQRLLNWPGAVADQHRASHANPGKVQPFGYVLDRDADPAP